MTTSYSIHDPVSMAGSTYKMSRLGFGVYNSPRDITIRSVTTAFEVGYRHIDTAMCILFPFLIRMYPIDKVA